MNDHSTGGLRQGVQRERRAEVARDEEGRETVAHDECERLLAQLEAERARLEAIVRQMPAGVVVAEVPSGRLILGNDHVLAAIVESSDDAIIRKTLGGIIVSWNSGAQRLYGYSAEEVLGKPISILIPPDLPDELPGIMARLKRGERIEHYETVRVRKDGVRIDVSVSIAPIKDASGRVSGAATIARDITERKRGMEAQRFLAEAGALLASSLDYETTLASVARLAVPQVTDWCTVDVVEEDGSLRRLAVAHVKPEHVELAREFQGRYPSDPDASAGVGRVLRSGQPEIYPEIADAMLRNAARDAEQLAILRRLGLRSAMIVPLVARGRALGAISFLSAESGRRYSPADLALAEELARRAALAADNARLYREAQRAVLARDEFLSVAAHELKTPVTSIRGFAQLVVRRLDKQGVLDPDQVRRAFQAIDQQSEKLTRLVSRLLDLSHIDGGRLALEREVVDVAALVRRVAAAAQGNTDRHAIVVQAPPEVAAFVDPLRFEQVLTNLLDNAIKYSPDGGPIETEISVPSPETVRLTITDHGLGIPPERRQGIFKPFQQGHAGRHFGGIGLGLYISRQIVQQHGGEIEIESPPEGGTRFVVSFPAGVPVAAME